MRYLQSDSSQTLGGDGSRTTRETIQIDTLTRVYSNGEWQQAIIHFLFYSTMHEDKYSSIISVVSMLEVLARMQNRARHPENFPASSQRQLMQAWVPAAHTFITVSQYQHILFYHGKMLEGGWGPSSCPTTATPDDVPAHSLQ